MSHSHETNPADRPPQEHEATESSHPPRTTAWQPDAATTVRKVCAYITRNGSELLAFDGPGHDALQIPKGTIEGNERPRKALHREVEEESGLRPDTAPTHVVTDIWTRRNHPPRRYLRHFYHVSVDEPRDSWTHTVTGSGAERGHEFEYTWVPFSDATDFALDLDDYVPLVRKRV